jgi:hypothetical protein
MTPAELRNAAHQWGAATLADLQASAVNAPSGTAFTAVRVAGGPRSVLVVCITDIDQIARVERAVELADDAKAEDWATFTLRDFVSPCAMGTGIVFEALRDEYGRRSSLALGAADPHSITIVEALAKID